MKRSLLLENESQIALTQGGYPVLKRLPVMNWEGNGGREYTIGCNVSGA